MIALLAVVRCPRCYQNIKSKQYPKKLKLRFLSIKVYAPLVIAPLAEDFETTKSVVWFDGSKFLQKFVTFLFFYFFLIFFQNCFWIFYFIFCFFFLQIYLKVIWNLCSLFFSAIFYTMSNEITNLIGKAIFNVCKTKLHDSIQHSWTLNPVRSGLF